MAALRAPLQIYKRPVSGSPLSTMNIDWLTVAGAAMDLHQTSRLTYTRIKCNL